MGFRPCEHLQEIIMFVAKLAAAMLVGFVLAGPGEPHQKTSKSANDIAFEQLKSLAGDWRVANPKDENEKAQTALSYRLIAGGSVVVETDFPGTGKEMVTVYYRDGDKLLLTHYCGCGNHPRMKARAGDNPKELIFDFEGGANFDPSKDMHMHDAVIQFIDANKIHTDWELYVGGKPAGKHSFDLVRKQ
jgi:hypothetical protein